MPQESSRGAVIFRMEGTQRLYLILHYESGHWEFVKGKVEKGEQDKETVVREAREETGITDLNFVFGFRDKIEYFYRREGKIVHKEVIFFLAETKTRDIKLSDEHIGFEWLDYDSAMARLTFENAKNILKKAEEFLKTHEVRPEYMKKLEKIEKGKFHHFKNVEELRKDIESF